MLGNRICTWHHRSKCEWTWLFVYSLIQGRGISPSFPLIPLQGFLSHGMKEWVLHSSVQHDMFCTQSIWDCVFIYHKLRVCLGQYLVDKTLRSNQRFRVYRSGVLKLRPAGWIQPPRVLNLAPVFTEPHHPAGGWGGETKQPQMTACHFICAPAPWLKSLRSPALKDFNSVSYLTEILRHT